MAPVNPYKKKKDEVTPTQIDPNTGETVQGAGAPTAFGKYVVKDGVATKVTREEFDRSTKEKRFDQVQKAVELEKIRRSAQGGLNASEVPTFEDFQAQQQSLKEQNLQNVVDAGGANPQEAQKNIVTDPQLLQQNPQSPLGKILNTATDIIGSEGAGQAIRNAFGVSLTKDQIQALREANPSEADQFIMRVQEQAVKRKNRRLGQKISEAIGGVVEALPAGGFILSQTNIQTPANQIKTIKNSVANYESIGDKLGIAGEADPIGTIQNINENLDNLDSLEGELQYLVLESAEYQASGEAQGIAIKLNTVRQNLINKRNEISARLVTGNQNPSSLELQNTLVELDKALESTKSLNS